MTRDRSRGVSIEAWRRSRARLGGFECPTRGDDDDGSLARVGTAWRDERGAVDVERGDASEVGAWTSVVVVSVWVWVWARGGVIATSSVVVVGGRRRWSSVVVGCASRERERERLTVDDFLCARVGAVRGHGCGEIIFGVAFRQG